MKAETAGKHLLPWGSVLAGCVLLYCATIDFDTTSARKVLDVVSRSDRLLTEQVLELRYGISKHFDELQMLESSLNVAATLLERESIDHRSFGDAGEEFLDDLNSALSVRTAAVAAFKAELAILRNSIAYFPQAADALQQATSDESARAAVGAFRRAGHEFSFAGSEPQRLRFQQLAQDNRRQEAGDDGTLREIAQHHARVILRLKPVVDELVEEIIELETTPIVNRGRALVAAEYERRQQRSTVIAGFGLIYVFLGLGQLLARFLRAQKAARHAEERAEELEHEVQQRTGELARAEERSRLILNNAGEGIYGVRRDGSIRFANPSAAEMLGLSVEELQGRCAGEIGPWLVGFEGVDDGSGRAERLAAETTYVHTSGRPVPVEFERSPITRDGEVIGVVVTFRDISERKRSEMRVKELNRQLMDAHRQAGMAEIATGVLHNVGNALNHVNVSMECVEESLQSSRVESLRRAVSLLQENSQSLGDFLEQDPKGKRLPEFLALTGEALAQERSAQLDGMRELRKGTEHIKEIVMRQQSYARVSGAAEEVSLAELVDDVVSMNLSENHCIEFHRDYRPTPHATLERHKLVQILGNLIQNAKQAVKQNDPGMRRLEVHVGQSGPERALIRVKDNGPGIESEHLSRLFEYGFTTKADGHGFGLHSCALAAQEMGAVLRGDSLGPGRGAVFEIELPLSRQAVDSPAVHGEGVPRSELASN